MSNFLPTSGLKWRDITAFDLNKYTINSTKGCVLKLILNILKLLELHNNYPLAPDKIEVKREICVSIN